MIASPISSDDDKASSQKTTLSTAEDKSQVHQKAIENKKQVFHDSSTTETKNRIKEHKVISQPGSDKYLADTVEIVHCALKPLKKESNTTANSSSEHIKMKIESEGRNEKLSKIIASELSKKHTKSTKEELQETNNNQNNTKIKGKNASQTADIRNISSSERCLKNQVCFPKHLISIQIPKASPSKPQITPPPTLKNQISFDNKESGKIPNQVPVGKSLEKNEIHHSKPEITNTSKEQVCLIQTTLPTTVTRNQVGSLNLATGPSLATIPIRSGLRLLSIVSTETSQNLQISRDQPDPSKALAKTPATNYSLSVSPHNTSKSPSVIPQSPITRADILTNSPKTAAAGDLARLSSTTTPQIPTMICSPKSPTITPQKPLVTSPKTPAITDVVGTLRSHINTPPTSVPTGVTTSAPNSPNSIAAAACSPQTTPLKENKFPRTAQSEPTHRTWVPPPDIDPMSQTFLRMPFTYQSLQVQCNHDNRTHVKRPMNAFMVWAKKNRSSIAKR